MYICIVFEINLFMMVYRLSKYLIASSIWCISPFYGYGLYHENKCIKMQNEFLYQITWSFFYILLAASKFPIHRRIRWIIICVSSFPNFLFSWIYIWHSVNFDHDVMQKHFFKIEFKGMYSFSSLSRQKISNTGLCWDDVVIDARQLHWDVRFITF